MQAYHTSVIKLNTYKYCKLMLLLQVQKKGVQAIIDNKTFKLPIATVTLSTSISMCNLFAN